MERRNIVRVVLGCISLVLLVATIASVSSLITWGIARGTYGIYKRDEMTTVYEPKGKPLRIEVIEIRNLGLLESWKVNVVVRKSGEVLQYQSGDLDRNGTMEFKSVVLGYDPDLISTANFSYTAFDDDGDGRADRQLICMPKLEGKPQRQYLDTDGDGVFEEEKERD